MSKNINSTGSNLLIKPKIINDFVITFSTVNGSGSATANTTLMRTFFKMGIPVTGKNIFPSNIQGLPTWYTLRLSKKGYLARVKEDDIVVAMNPSTINKEIDQIVPGGALFYPDDLKISNTREDIIYYPMPIRKIIKESEVAPSLKDYISNMVYVGILAQMLEIPQDLIREALNFHFKNKVKPVSLNMEVIQKSAEWARENLTKADPYYVETMQGNEGWIMTDGNTAGALGSLFGGVQFTAWYPITPASSLAESIHEFIPELRTDPVSGKQTSVIVQAEDELAAIGMAIGAGWGGLRSMTSTSGPGLSLMTEFIGLAYYAEIPVVIWDVQRVGPSTGLPTRTAQGDITFVKFMGHGDTDNIMLFPGSVNECFEFGWRSFDIAERLQTPVVIMTDLDLGMNEWMTTKFYYPDQPMDRGKVLWEEDLQKMLDKYQNEFGRYKDLDGDGITYRTLVGNQHPRAAYFTRGTGHDEYAKYTEDPVIWEESLTRIKKKFEIGKQYLPKPLIHSNGSKKGIICVGSASFAVDEALDILAEEKIILDCMRIRSIPFHEEVNDFLISHDLIYIVELNRDGQLSQLLTLAAPVQAKKFRNVNKIDGLPLTAKWIVSEICKVEEE
ncbi:MAG: 2-oxoacid:acceptor oxidoreductase subunit alpha [Anaerolineaceae bacterium]|jgi:2-oxoglutarate ferredoxin oxidoreductase subunit alpha|nr:2-oxoacid:acceptor oxidoreductase subunit alpha [Anaerolineaceae bacterium]